MVELSLSTLEGEEQNAMSDDSTSPEHVIKDVFLNETDRLLARMAARLLMALDAAQSRENEAGCLVQAYRHDLSDAHPSVDPALLDEMTLGFSVALTMNMERINDGDDEEDEELDRIRGTPLVRSRVLEAIRRYVKMVDPRH